MLKSYHGHSPAEFRVENKKCETQFHMKRQNKYEIFNIGTRVSTVESAMIGGCPLKCITQSFTP